MTPTPPTMTAVVQPAYGLDAIEIGERPVPTPGPGQLRIKVSASALNPMDWHLATGSPRIVRLVEGLRRPKHEIPGREACGVVDELGPDVTGFEIGQTVFGWVTGAFAEYTIAEADRMWPAPTGMTEFECAALPVAGATALEAIERGDVAGKRVAVNGASGGVGHYAVQIAKARGAQWVAGVCSGRNADFVHGLGADQVIEYDSDDFTSERWDVIIDCIGNRTGARHPAGACRRRPLDRGRRPQQERATRPTPPPGGQAHSLAVRLAVLSLVRTRRGRAVSRGNCRTRRPRPGPLPSQRHSHDGRCAGWLRPDRKRSHGRQTRRQDRSSRSHEINQRRIDRRGTDRSEQRDRCPIVTTTTTTPRPDSVTGLNERIALLEKKAVIFALWIFVLLNFIFRDLHELGKAEFLEQALTGTYNGRELTEALFLLGGIMVEIPIAMALMTWILPLRSNRWANIIIPPALGAHPHRSGWRPRRLLPLQPHADRTRSHRLASVELGKARVINP